MLVMKVKEAHTNALFTVAHDGRDYRAVQLVDRMGNTIYANTAIEVDDDVLVVEVPGLLYPPSASTKDDASEAVSHIIVGLIPASIWQEIPNYSDLVRQS